ncbi:hypothetical protein AUP07_0757 [methanogenic archaeon mixed culture ISO4-G1]|nr:hypothetical protein AUP07_0757 [methanogenic archaeon mixed culture ISO4-G1]
MLSPQASIVPMDLYEHYLSSLEEAEMKDESAYIFFISAGIRFYIHMTNAKVIFKEMSEGDNPVSYSDFIQLQTLRETFEECKQRCEMMRDETDLPYRSAEKYIDLALETISVMTRVHLRKQIISEELAYLIDRIESTSCDDFNKLFLPDFDPHHRERIVLFENSFKTRIDIFLAMLLVYVDMGL